MSIDNITIDKNTYRRIELNGPDCNQCDIKINEKNDLLKFCKLCVKFNPYNSIYKRVPERKKTYFQLLRELGDWKPENKHVTSESECEMIRLHFDLGSMNDLELRNLRDFTVSFYHAKMEQNKENFDALHAMMSITAVIDLQLRNLIL